jgi:general secretion pathway protein F
MGGALSMSEASLERLLVSLAEALEAGLGVVQYLENPAASAALPPGVARRLLVSLEQGATLSVSLGRLPGISRAEVALVGAGERTGDLPGVLRSLVSAREERRKVRRGFLLGLLYPGLMVCAAGCLLPLPLVVTEGFGAWLSWSVWPTLAVVLLGVFGVWVWPRLGPESWWKAAPRRLALGFPVLGRALERGAHGVFAQILGRCVAAGLPIHASVSAAVLAADHPRLLAQERAILGAIDGGATLAEALAAAGVFSREFVGRVAQAELTGKLDEVLPRLGEEEEAARRRAVIAATGAVAALVLVGVLAAVAYGIVRGAQGYFEALDGSIKEQTR